MPDGRFTSRSISICAQLKRVSMQADFLFGRMIPHLDRDGLLNGDPETVKAIAVPLRKEFTLGAIEDALHELADEKLVVWYVVDGQMVLSFPGFARHQHGMKYDREAASRFPRSGPSPELVRRRSSDVADQVLPSEVKLSEVKGSEVGGESILPSPLPHTALSAKAGARKPKREYPPEFEELWAAYPHPPGDSKQDAYRCVETRLKEGNTYEILRAGVTQYRTFIMSQDRLGTKFCKMGSTFFGPGMHFLSDWSYREVTDIGRKPNAGEVTGKTIDDIIARMSA